jgi:D-alanyl-D-alanine carboxypeptidase
MLLTFGESRGFRTIIVGFLAGVAVLALAVDSADAKGKKRHAKKGGGYNPPYAAIVVDANSGSVLHAADADGIRHPASLTKIMTLYLLFERIEAGKIKPDTPLKVSAHAAAQSPTKLGLKAGDTITVEDAIRGLVTKSANDAAVVIAETLAGDEEDFAKLMTRKARALGMSRTVYMNASGLPDRDQVTTARDQALLGRAIQDRFPRQYRYFSTKSFTFRGKTMGNHNHLLGSVQGVDGIKTGYIQASGFNLVASMKRNNRHLVAAVLGGSSGGARDARMRSLLEKHIVEASAGRTAPTIAERDGEVETAPVAVASAGDVPHVAPPTSAAAPMPATPINSSRSESAAAAAVAPPKAAAGAVDPIKPIAVRTIKVKLNGVQTASLTPPLAHLPVIAVKDEPAAPKAAGQPGQTVATKAAADTPVSRAQPVAPAAQAAATADPAAQAAPAKPAVAPATPIQAVAVASSPEPSHAVAAPAPAPVQVASAAPTTAVPAPAPAPVQVASAAPTIAVPALAPAPVQVASAAPTIAVPAPAPAPTETAAPSAQSAKVVHSGWIIQVGAFEAEREAKDRLSSAQTKAKHLLARADAFTETVVKDNRTFFRARFAGLEKDEAEAACKYLKRNDFACMTLKN